jgi:hypothetical protein
VKILNFKDTKIRNVNLEVDANQILNDIKDQKPEQCCFKNRLVDGFIIGATRSFNKGRRPNNLTTNKNEVIDSIPTPSLSDKDEITFILQVIAYAHLLEQVGKDEDKIRDLHNILIDLSKCASISERYFKGGWEVPVEGNFKQICNSSYPDAELINDIDFQDVLEED